MKQAIKAISLSVILGFSTSLSAQNSLSIKNCYSIECLQQNFKTVENLSLSQRKLKKLPIEIFQAKNLRQLNLVNTGIRKLPDSLGVLKNLEHVKLEKNEKLKQKEIFRQLAKIESLKSLDLSNNSWLYLSNDVEQLNGLKTLNLSNNYIEDLPAELFTNIQLESLFLNSNKLKSLPAEIQLTATLNTLDVSYNNKLNLRESIMYFEMISSLKNLTLGNVDRTPKELKDLQQIKHLTIREGNCNKFLEICSEIANLESLEIIYPDKDLKSKETQYLTNLQNLRSLKIVSLNSIDLGNSELKLPNLTRLILQANELFVGTLDSNRTPELTQVSITNSIFSEKQNELLADNLIELRNLEIKSSTGLQSIDLSQFDSLETINFAYSGMDLSVENFNLSSPIKDINILENNISEVDLAVLQTSYETARIVSPNTFKTTGQSVVSNAEKIEVSDLENEMDFTYQPQKENRIETTSGYEIAIPKGAFIDKNGLPIDQPVQVKVTTYGSPLEMALAGIPMTYNENMEPRFFSSSSMLRVETENNGQEIQINPNSPLSAKMPVKRSTDTLYLLNEATGLWEKQPAPQLRTISSSDILNARYQLAISARLNRPVRPRKPENKIRYERITVETKKAKDRASFSFKVYPKYNPISMGIHQKKFRQIRQIRKHTWYYDGDKADIDKATLDSLSRFFKKYYTRRIDKKITNEPKDAKPSIIRDVELIPNLEKDNFTMRILIGNKFLEIPCYPEINPRNHELEAKRIRAFYKSYNRVNDRKTRAWNKIGTRYKSDMERYENKIDSYTKDLITYNLEFQKLLNKSLNIDLPDSFLYMTGDELAAQNINIPVQQNLQILGFGTFNCDVIYRFTEPVQFKGVLAGTDGEELKPENIIVLDKTQNGTLNTRWKNKFMYDAGGDIAIIAPLKNGKLAYISSAELKTLDLKKANRLIMKIIDTNKQSFSEIEKLL